LQAALGGLNILTKKEHNDTEALAKALPDENGNNLNRKDHRRADTIAVALEYNPESKFAPKIVAGGRGKIAEQILRIAFDRDIKVREDADLAEMLSVIDIDSEIPLKAFAAVAEILTYVYQANGDAPIYMEDVMQESPLNHQQKQENSNDDKTEETT
tara:strand:+ start:295 stop:765 length:471 start_codon:yes stop_codon:yes gene_type:complete